MLLMKAKGIQAARLGEPLRISLSKILSSQLSSGGRCSFQGEREGRMGITGKVSVRNNVLWWRSF